jgi:crotonobetainyl-CoA:carnitine CoA-transferase CaiB-like acyl-CoA transferase
MTHEGPDEGPAYEGLRVVDLSQGVAGPHCGMPGLPQPAPGAASARSPAIGEHTLEVLLELGLDPNAIAALEAAGVVRTPARAEGAAAPES